MPASTAQALQGRGGIGGTTISLRADHRLPTLVMEDVRSPGDGTSTGTPKPRCKCWCLANYEGSFRSVVGRRLHMRVRDVGIQRYGCSGMNAWPSSGDCCFEPEPLEVENSSKPVCLNATDL